MKIFVVLLFVISAVLAGKEVPIVSRSRTSGTLEEEPSANEVSEKAEVKVTVKAKTKSKPAAKKSAKKSAPKRKKTVEEVEGKKIADQVKKSVKRIAEANKKRQHQANPFKVGCYSAVISNILTICVIILIAVVW
jgi:CHASE3 domain sensor protein